MQIPCFSIYGMESFINRFLWGLYMRKTDSLFAKNVGFKDIAQNHKGELISRGQLIMYYTVLPVSETCKKKKTRTLWNKPISQIIDIVSAQLKKVKTFSVCRPVAAKVI